MTVITEIPGGVPRIPVSDLAADLPQGTLGDGARTAIAHLRQEGLRNRDATAKMDPKVSADPVAEAREALRPGPAASQKVSEAERSIQSLDALSQMTWRMVTFELGSASLQKTDKSIKMFIQAQ